MFVSPFKTVFHNNNKIVNVLVQFTRDDEMHLTIAILDTKGLVLMINKTYFFSFTYRDERTFE